MVIERTVLFEIFIQSLEAGGCLRSTMRALILEDVIIKLRHV